MDKKILNNLKKEHWVGGQQVYNFDDCQTSQVNIRPNNDVTLGNFRSDPLIPGGFVAHPTTIRAMRKDIFVGGNDFDLHQQLYHCESCGKELDLQFWQFCPYCESQFQNLTI